jgi:hypothetical protein
MKNRFIQNQKFAALLNQSINSQFDIDQKKILTMQLK